MFRITRRRRITITRITAISYTGPLDGRRRLDRASGLIVRAEAGDGTVEGIGEATVGSADRDAAWAATEDRIRRLVGTRIPLGIDPTLPLDRLAGWTSPPKKAPAGVRAAHLAVELALLDLIMTSAKTSPQDVWGDHSPDRALLLRLPRRKPESFLRDLADQQRSGQLPANVVVEAGAGRPDFAHIHALVDRMNSDDFRMSIIVRMDSGHGIDQAKKISGISLSPDRMGSFLAARDAAIRLKNQLPTILVALSASGRGSDITRTAFSVFGTSTPAVDVIVEPTRRGGWPDQLTVAGGVGVFGRLDLGKLSAIADRIVETPSKSLPERPAMNTYDDEITPLTPYGVPKQTLLEIEALKGGLSTRRYGPQLFLAEHKALTTPIAFSGPQSSLTSVAAGRIAQHKGLTRHVLDANGLPIAPGGWFPTKATTDIIAAAAELGFPLVVKPADGIQGHAVTTGIRSIGELKAALKRVSASRYGKDGIILESMVTGNDYRVLATPTEVISVVRRDPGFVIGDGLHSVQELILHANIGRRRNPYLGRHLTRVDDTAIAVLRAQGFTLTSVPPAGTSVRLAQVANLSQGGFSTEVSESAHPSLHELAIRAVSSIPGLPYAGIDLFMEDHTKPIDEQEVTIIEINHNPALMLHPYPMYGRPRNVNRHLLREFAAMQGLVLENPRDPLSVHFSAFGKVQGVGYRRWMADAAKQLAITGWVRNGRSPDHVEAVFHGRAVRIAAMIRLAFNGPPGAKVVEMLIEPSDHHATSTFVVHRQEGDREENDVRGA